MPILLLSEGEGEKKERVLSVSFTKKRKGKRSGDEGPATVCQRKKKKNMFFSDY